MNSGVYRINEYSGQEYDITSHSRVTVRIIYTAEWHMKAGGNARIHASQQVSIPPYAFSGAGIIVEAKKSTTLFPGMPVAVLGVSDAELKSELISADEAAVISIPDSVSPRVAALCGPGAFYMNAIRSAKMPLGATCAVCGDNIAGLTELLFACGYSSCTVDEADYIFTFDSQALNGVQLRKNAVIIGLGDSQICLTSGNECRIISVQTPGADWDDSGISDRKVVYPSAYVQNTVTENARCFLEIIRAQPDRFVHCWEGKLTSMSSDDALCESQHENIPFAGGVFQPYAELLTNRSKPIMALLYTPPMCESMSEAVDAAIQTVNGWACQTPKSVVAPVVENAVLEYADGSVATIQILPSGATLHAEIHWEGRSLIADGDAVHLY